MLSFSIKFGFLLPNSQGKTKMENSNDSFTTGKGKAQQVLNRDKDFLSPYSKINFRYEYGFTYRTMGSVVDNLLNYVYYCSIYNIFIKCPECHSFKQQLLVRHQ